MILIMKMMTLFPLLLLLFLLLLLIATILFLFISGFFPKNHLIWLITKDMNNNLARFKKVICK